MEMISIVSEGMRMGHGFFGGRGGGGGGVEKVKRIKGITSSKK